MLLFGETATGMQLWDAMRSLDVLAAHPQVDPKRLGLDRPVRRRHR